MTVSPWLGLTSLILSSLLTSQMASASQSSTCSVPVSSAPPVGDAALDARAPNSLFKRLDIKGLSDDPSATDSIVAADFNKDGLNDLLLVKGDKQELRLLLNKGCFAFEDANLQVIESGMTAKTMGRGLAIANVVDFDGDGWLDIFLSRNPNPRKIEPMGNLLLMAQGGFQTFRDVGPAKGITNSEAYNRGSSFGDIDQDGSLDIAVAADQIGSLPVGIAQQRLYQFKSPTGGFKDGVFSDLGGTPLAEGFGGPFRCSLNDKAGPLVSLRDLDNDGDMDLIQSYHQDLQRAKVSDACTPANMSYGIQVWRNQLRETGTFKLTPQPVSGFGGLASYRFSQQLQDYEPVGEAVSLPYLFFADTDNDGDLDVLGVGASDSSWRLGSTKISGQFWRNDGAFNFVEATDATGFGPVNWSYSQWLEFWKDTSKGFSPMAQRFCMASWQPKRCKDDSEANTRFYGADAVIADFNNDGWLDAVVVDRHESDVNVGSLRNVLFLNKGNGQFSVTTTEVSGIDVNSIAMEASDLNNDGLIDLIAVADPANSFIRVNPTDPTLPPDRFASKIFWNSGAQGAAQNNWVKLRFVGLSDAALIGARVERLASNGTNRGLRIVSSNHSYKSGGALDVHWGLAKDRSARFRITLLSGKSKTISISRLNRLHEVNLAALR